MTFTSDMEQKTQGPKLPTAKCQMPDQSATTQITLFDALAFKCLLFVSLPSYTLLDCQRLKTKQKMAMYFKSYYISIDTDFKHTSTLVCFVDFLAP